MLSQKNLYLHTVAPGKNFEPKERHEISIQIHKLELIDIDQAFIRYS